MNEMEFASDAVKAMPQIYVGYVALSGSSLNFALAMLLGHEVDIDPERAEHAPGPDQFRIKYKGKDYWSWFPTWNPVVKHDQSGPLEQKFLLDSWIDKVEGDSQTWGASMNNEGGSRIGSYAYGPTPAVARLRAIVGFYANQRPVLIPEALLQ